MQLWDSCKKELSFNLVDCDFAPADLPDQLPIEFTILRTIPGRDRPDYTLAACKKPVYYHGQAIKYLIVAPRFTGVYLDENTQKIDLAVAYVMDESLLQDKILVFEKCKPAAVCTAVRT